MKRLLGIFSLMIVAGLLQVSAQYNVTVLHFTKDAITMRCVGYGKKATIASKDAELSAIKTLLFFGVPGTRYSIPLVAEDRAKIEAKHQNFFASFYDKGYRDFIETSIISAPFGKNALKQKCITLDVCVRSTQLRGYLEQNGIIRRFGL